MANRRGSEEMTAWLQRLRDYVRSASFDQERRLACEEYLGTMAVGAPTEPALAEHPVEQLETRVADSDWFLFHRCHSRWDRTPVRLFVEQTPDLPARVAENLLACEQSVGSVFCVVSGDTEAVVVHDLGGEAGDYYRVMLTEEQTWIVQGAMVRGRLVRWDGEYWFHGQPERWPALVRDVVGHRRGFAVGPGLRGRGRSEELSLSARRVLRLASRTMWLRERRRHR
ncbi:MAG: hypothetical protein HZB16_11470 [Armatimonadetes bacterium]|nr:hypothetical protein [Armatimonadota bacterium]